MPVHAIGIDLGTTYSAVAHLDAAGRTTIVRNAEGEILTPSVVLFDNEEIVVGRQAKKMATMRPESVADCAKRDMGKPHYSKPINGKRMPPEVIQSCILKKLKDDTIAALGPELQCVITVPAYFDEPRRKATLDAGEMAGLDVLDIVNEPTAAALAFGETLGYLTPQGTAAKPLKVLVYDLGGGTFDVTVIDLRPGDVRTLATDGDVQLGGFDWDMRLVDYAANQFQERVGSDPRNNSSSKAALLREAEDAKQTLSVRGHAAMHIKHSIHSVDVSISRQQFEELTADLLERTAHTTRGVLTAAKLTWKEIDRVLLVGGSTRMPMVERMIEQLSGIKPDHSVHPDEAVARGAALFAAYLLHDQTAPATEPPQAFSVIDVNSHTLGIEGIDPQTGRKENSFVIPRNTPLPVKVNKKCVTRKDDQRTIVVQVLEGESKFPDQCSPIARAVLRAIPEHLPQGTPIDVTYEYQTNGRLHVLARLNAHPPREIKIELEREQGLSPEVIGRWKRILGGTQQRFESFESLLDAALEMAPDPVSQPASGSSGRVSSPLRDNVFSSGSSASASPSVFESADISQYLPPTAVIPPAAPLAQTVPQPTPLHQPPAAAAMSAVGLSGIVEPDDDSGGTDWRLIALLGGLFVVTIVGLMAGYYVLVALTHWNPLNISLPGLPSS